ncbi:preprotein translocase subunit SecA [Thermithiobacillus plumbiphilus]|uniref:Protein translocase subunit SecA n=1 Tax=Thermithiobacillus plumbiphilus TaxID=1729899 RepID=A0ABU9D5R9_9PROT
MISSLVRRFIGSRNDRTISRLQGLVARTNALEADLAKLSDAELAAKTVEFRQRLAKGETLDDIQPEAFAVAREAGKRTLGMRHFDVQLIGGMVLHQGKIAEMRTGEGKTLVATLAAYLNALPGEGVHVVTVNDYLARRDAEWMGRIYRFLGLSVGVIVSDLGQEERRAAYAADITYGTNNEFGFDYLRDNMAFRPEERVQRKLNYAIIDEVDSILIDEARTPLIISGPTDDNTDLYQRVDKVIPHLQAEEDYTVDEKARQVMLTEEGTEKAENLLREMGMLQEGNLYDVTNINLVHHLNQALRAHTLFKREVDYIVRDDQVIIIDEFTGRMMSGRRWSEGLHQAVEAKEGVRIQNENQTLASITFQNYFRMYQKLSGMTGTADTEAYELHQIYGLDVVVIPTHRPVQRKDMPDLVYRTAQEKYKAIIDEIRDCYERGQPVLVGTASIESNELLASLLKQAKIPHEVLNAKQHEREAEIVAQAGKPKAVTIATNMAGRGTDIVLGGSIEADIHAIEQDETLSDEQRKARIQELRAVWQKRHDEVLGLGGLHIVGTERHESRRVDNQLRGRAGRQGDPGSSRFFLSLEDNLMRIFASERISVIMQRLGMQEGEAIEHKWVTKAIENAQRKVEGRNFDIRKQLLEYDDVANEQRKVIYQQRNQIMDTNDISDMVRDLRREVLEEVLATYAPAGVMEEEWDLAGLEEGLERQFGAQLPVRSWMAADGNLDRQSLFDRLLQEVTAIYEAKTQQIGEPVMRHFEKAAMLQVLDAQWKDHLAAMDHLRQGIHLRGYAQKNPKQEYKREAFEMFNAMIGRLKVELIELVSKVHVAAEQDVEAFEAQHQQPSRMQFQHPALDDAGGDPADMPAASPQTSVREGAKVGRNEPCPCGSGRKYKHCCGRLS